VLAVGSFRLFHFLAKKRSREKNEVDRGEDSELAGIRALRESVEEPRERSDEILKLGKPEGALSRGGSEKGPGSPLSRHFTLLAGGAAFKKLALDLLVDLAELLGSKLPRSDVGPLLGCHIDLDQPAPPERCHILGGQNISDAASRSYSSRDQRWASTAAVAMARIPPERYHDLETGDRLDGPPALSRVLADLAGGRVTE
jgi:hypothetical protein